MCHCLNLNEHVNEISELQQRERYDFLSISLIKLLYTLEVIWTILWWFLVFDSDGHYELILWEELYKDFSKILIFLSCTEKNIFENMRVSKYW